MEGKAIVITVAFVASAVDTAAVAVVVVDVVILDIIGIIIFINKCMHIKLLKF